MGMGVFRMIIDECVIRHDWIFGEEDLEALITYAYCCKCNRRVYRPRHKSEEDWKWEMFK